MALFKRAWQALKVLPHPSHIGSFLPLIRAFKWDTVWLYISRVIGTTRGHIWKFKKSPFLLSKFKSSNFDLLYFQCPLRYRVIQYLIWKLLLVVKMSQEGLGMAALLGSAKPSWKVPFYHIKRHTVPIILRLSVWTLQNLPNFLFIKFPKHRENSTSNSLTMPW